MSTEISMRLEGPEGVTLNREVIEEHHEQVGGLDLSLKLVKVTYECTVSRDAEVAMRNFQQAKELLAGMQEQLKKQERKEREPLVRGALKIIRSAAHGLEKLSDQAAKLPANKVADVSKAIEKVVESLFDNGNESEEEEALLAFERKKSELNSYWFLQPGQSRVPYTQHTDWEDVDSNTVDYEVIIESQSK